MLANDFDSLLMGQLINRCKFIFSDLMIGRLGVKILKNIKKNVNWK